MSAYLKFFQLEKSPFDTRAQSNLVLGTKALRGAFSEIETGLSDGAPRICVNGKAGLGKTSLARALPKLLGETARVVLILNPSLPWSTLRAAIVKQLDLAEGNLSRKTLMRARAEGRQLVIAVDQAERISNESLEHFDILLGYKNDDDEQLLHCVLLANLEAAASMHTDEGEPCPLLWWLDRLNTLQLEFHPIPTGGVASYVHKHLKRAGWKGGQIFSAEAMQTIHRLTGGVPREMSDLCERSLELAAEQETDRIDVAMVEECFGEIPLEEAVPNETMFSTNGDDGEARDTDGRSEYERTGPGPGESPPARASFSTPETDPSAVPAPDDDRRIDRMPMAGRRAQAQNDGPLSLDSFFGDSTFDSPSPAEVQAPAHSLPSAPEPSFEARDDATDEAPFHEDAFDEDAPHDRGGLVRKIGLAAGVLLAVGLGGAVAMQYFGSDDGASQTAKPAVLARPKASAPVEPAPVAGIEPAFNVEAPEGAPTANPGVASLSWFDPEEPAPLRGAEGDPVERRSGTGKVPVVDRSLDDDPGLMDDLEQALEGGPLPTDTPLAPPGDAAAGQPVPASPAPAGGWQDPAEAEIDAPFW